MTQTARLELTPFEMEFASAPQMPTSAAIASLRREPRFKPALVSLAADNLKYYQRRWLASRVINDRARFAMGLVAMYLHFSQRPDVPGSGLTAARFRDICIGAGLCGGGRVEGLLMVMRATGFIERVETAEQGVRRFAPTPKLIAHHRGRNHELLSALDILRGDTHFADRLGLVGDNAFYPNFCLAMARMFGAGFRMSNAAPELRKIIDRDAGFAMMTCALLASPEYAELVPEEMRPATVSELARRFSVSRMHVRSVQRDAETAGLLIRHGDSERVTVLPALIDAVERFFASGFVMIETCAQVAAAQEA